jgi:hypothetical protein
LLIIISKEKAPIKYGPEKNLSHATGKARKWLATKDTLTTASAAGVDINMLKGGGLLT